MSSRKNRVLVLPAPQDIQQISGRFGDNVEIIKGFYRSIEFRFNHELVISHKGINLKEFDFVWLSSLFGLRDISRAISIYLDHHRVPHTKINYGEGVSKIVDITRFEIENIPIPDTFYSNKESIDAKIENIVEFLGFPLIIKDTQGSRGKNSFFVKSKQELKKVIKELPESRGFVFQQYIPNDYDWGVLVADGKVVSAEKSYRHNDEFRNNACWGAKEKFEDVCELDENIKEMAEKACNILKLEWGRADIVIDKYSNEPYLLEVNRFPGMTAGSTEEDAFYHYLNKKLLAEDLA